MSFFLCRLLGCKVLSPISLCPRCHTSLGHDVMAGTSNPSPCYPLHGLLVLIAAWSLGVGTGRGRGCGVWHRASHWDCLSPPSVEFRKRRLSTIIKTCRACFSPILDGEHETLAWRTETTTGPLLEVWEARGSSGFLFQNCLLPRESGFSFYS